jgi:hypothetical protein
MTLEQAIKTQILALEEVHKNLGLLGVMTPAKEKSIIHEVGLILPALCGRLREVNRSLPPKRSSRRLKKDFSVTVNPNLL